MTEKSDDGAGPFFDAFRNFGRNLKLPKIEIEDIVSHHKKNIRTLEEAARNTTEGAQAIMSQQRKALEETLADITHMVQDARDGGLNKENAREVISDQMEFTKRSFEATIKNATSTAGIVGDVSRENLNVFKERLRNGIEEIKSTMDSESDDGDPPVKPAK
jgi:phasin family protein